jgi:hypothetical protein
MAMWGRNNDDSPSSGKATTEVRSAQLEPIQIKKRATSMENEIEAKVRSSHWKSQRCFRGVEGRLKVEKMKGRARQ